MTATASTCSGPTRCSSSRWTRRSGTRRREGASTTRRRDAELAAIGYLTIRVTWTDLTKHRRSDHAHRRHLRLRRPHPRGRYGLTGQAASTSLTSNEGDVDSHLASHVDPRLPAPELVGQWTIALRPPSPGPGPRSRRRSSRLGAEATLAAATPPQQAELAHADPHRDVDRVLVVDPSAPASASAASGGPAASTIGSWSLRHWRAPCSGMARRSEAERVPPSRERARRRPRWTGRRAPASRGVERAHTPPETAKTLAATMVP